LGDRGPNGRKTDTTPNVQPKDMADEVIGCRKGAGEMTGEPRPRPGEYRQAIGCS